MPDCPGGAHHPNGQVRGPLRLGRGRAEASVTANSAGRRASASQRYGWILRVEQHRRAAQMASSAQAARETGTGATEGETYEIPLTFTFRTGIRAPCTAWESTLFWISTSAIHPRRRSAVRWSRSGRLHRFQTQVAGRVEPITGYEYANEIPDPVDQPTGDSGKQPQSLALHSP